MASSISKAADFALALCARILAANHSGFSFKISAVRYETMFFRGSLGVDLSFRTKFWYNEI